jgi:hypothetical protein
MHNKQFKDPVHGYIRVPQIYCKYFIDTPIFQRLRHIEQTSMRCLFPGAHHDRFIHSLGVFHLGQWMYEVLLNNTAGDQAIHAALQEKSLKHTFLIACLMHDCGHAPFSHTLEKFYNDSGVSGGVHNQAFASLSDCFQLEDFKVEEKEFKPAHHEAMSAVVLKECFDGKTPDLDWDATLAARMITGCKHHSPGTLTLRVQNILIGLLNSSAIDMDKLDYIMRDTWASGVKNSAIDVQRLIEAATIVNAGTENIRLAYRKSALSVIQSVVDARNYLYEWIYNHHTVLYYAEMLKRSVLDLGEVLDEGQTRGQGLTNLFSKRVFQESIRLREGQMGPVARLPTDGDILLFLKIFCTDKPFFKVYASHTAEHFAVWKTEAEYRSIFKGHQYQITENRCKKVLEKIGVPKGDLIFCDGKAKLHTLQESEIVIDFGERQASFTDVIPQKVQQSGNKKTEFFYLYVPNSFKQQKDEIIHALVSEAQI